MKLHGSIEGDLKAILAEETAALVPDLRQGIANAGNVIQAALRDQVVAAGLGDGLAKAWQKRDYPNASTAPLSPASLVYSKATVLHAVFSEGATITAHGARYLAIPTREAEALGLALTNTRRDGNATGSIPRRASMVANAIALVGSANTRTIDISKGRKLILYRVPQGRGGGKSFRVAGGRGVGFARGKEIVLFILVPQVRLRPRLDIQAVRGRAPDVLAAEIDAALARS